MSSIRCFLLIPTNRAQRSLRRYSSFNTTDDKCTSGYGYHNAVEVLPGEVEWNDPNCNGRGEPPANHNDPRWPVKCVCGYEFLETDEWQQNVHRLFERTDGGEATTIDRAPVGAMWWAEWLSEISSTSRFHRERGGGPHLMVRTPGGDWDIDSKASNGDGWNRTGDPPGVTATPSIVAGRYHGWLRDGVLVEC